MNYQTKRKRHLIFLGQIMISLVMILIFTQAIYSQTAIDHNKSDSIQRMLAKVINDGKAPGMIAAITSSEGIIAIASAGERKTGSGIKFTTSDKIHLGSCTKAMTATMIATLVAEGKLSWDTKLIDAIPELKQKIHSDYHKITLWNLLTHRAGLFKNPSDWGAFEKKEITERRLALIVENMVSSSSFLQGEFHYSNFGYMVAACMAERVTGLSWETLMKKRLFEPLGMSTAGFGAPNTSDQINQPWGHKKAWYGYGWKTDQTDNPEALGPAGMVHCNIEDWGKFLALQMTNTNPILDRKFLDKLIEPVDGHFYAGGWGVAMQDWAKGKMITHAGSNGIWYTNVLITPNLDRAFIVSTNSRDFGVTEDLCTEVTNKLIRMELDI
jgi:CubicO group peptidase (beta-lactamase class C family)